MPSHKDERDCIEVMVVGFCLTSRDSGFGLMHLVRSFSAYYCYYKVVGVIIMPKAISNPTNGMLSIEKR